MLWKNKKLQQNDAYHSRKSENSDYHSYRHCRHKLCKKVIHNAPLEIFKNLFKSLLNFFFGVIVVYFITFIRVCKQNCLNKNPNKNLNKNLNKNFECVIYFENEAIIFTTLLAERQTNFEFELFIIYE